MNAESLGAFIGVGIHTYIRKLSDSEQAVVAWKAITNMPEEEWSRICTELAKDVVKGIKDRRFD
jgi:hypothetical protein